MFHLVLAESALECVPEGLHGHRSVRARAKRAGRPAAETLLDVSWHYAAMRDLDMREKRGRPDITHFSVLAATSTPLYRSGGMRVYVHTARDVVVRLAPGVRIPKSYHRFEGLFARLLARGSAGAPDGALLEASPCGIGDLLGSIGPSATAGLSTRGAPGSCRDIIAGMGPDPCVVVGGFQRGAFGERTRAALDGMHSIWPGPLEAHVVVSRMVYEAENHFNGAGTQQSGAVIV